MYLDHMLVEFEQNRIARTIQNLEFCDKKWLTIFDKVLTAILKDVSVTKQYFDAKLII